MSPLNEIAPDLERIIVEACFGVIWDRPALSIEQRSLATISVLTALGMERQLDRHILIALKVDLSPEQIVEVLFHLFFYLGAPTVNSAFIVAKGVFEREGIIVDPVRVYDITEDPDEMYRRGVAKRREILDDAAVDPSSEVASVNRDRERFSREYLWGSVWTRPGLDMNSRCICTIAALTCLGRDRMIRDYVGAAIHVGLTKEQLAELFLHLSLYVGFPSAWSANAVASEVFQTH